MTDYSDYHFSGQKEGEEVILLLRRHWIKVVWPLLYTLIAFLVPLLAWAWILSGMFGNFVPMQWVWIASAAWGVLGLFLLVYNWLDWYLDIFLVTSQRIIDITQNGLFHRMVGETPLDNVQDVIYEIKGILPMLFNFGNVTIHTAGPSGNIMFEDVSNPQGVQRFLLHQVDVYKDANTKETATPEDLLQLMLSHERQKLLSRHETTGTLEPANNVPRLEGNGVPSNDRLLEEG